jgi:rhamnosyltransferase
MISIIIRAKNEAQYIGEVLKAVLAQDDPEEFEILVIDSGSSDGTKEVVRRFPVHLEEIPSDRFTFGSALNLGMELAKGRIVVYLSAHCTPTTHDWLRHLVEPLRRESKLVATFGRQEPRKGMNPFEETVLEGDFPADRLQAPHALFSNANCAIWRSVLENNPFDEDLKSSEDLVWRMRFAPEQIFYAPDASVYHSHPINWRYWAQRYERDGDATVEMQRRHGIINPYILRNGSLAKTAKEFLVICVNRWISFALEGYFRFIPLVPFFEITRVWFTARGIRRAKLIRAR